MPWNPDRYQQFKQERSAPFDDLLRLVDCREGLEVVDLGCGTGELTRRLADAPPESKVLGVDSSREMLARAAEQTRPGLQFEHAQIENVTGQWDLVFSNAAIQGMRLSEAGKRHSTNSTGFQLHYWALAALACGLGRPAEARDYIQKLLQYTDPEANVLPILWIIPSAVYTLVKTDPEKAVELVAWIVTCDDAALNWVRRWPLFDLDRIQIQLQTRMETYAYQIHWKMGQTFSFDIVRAYLHQEFRASPAAFDEIPPHQLLTVRESEILQLMAAGMTNPQIAAQLVIGAGTVKSHTLSIYRKLDVANRTQAVVRAQELRLLDV